MRRRGYKTAVAARNQYKDKPWFKSVGAGWSNGRRVLFMFCKYPPFGAELPTHILGLPLIVVVQDKRAY